VTDDIKDHGEIYLSAKIVRQWMADYTSLIAQRAALGQQITELQSKQNQVVQKISEVTSKLYGAGQLLEPVRDWIIEQEFNAQPDNTTLPKAILTVLSRTPGGHPVPRQNIQSLIAGAGYPQQRLQQNPNYLYIALKRLLDRKLIQEGPAAHYQLTNDGRAEAQKP
jgi:hypothetical protein